MKKSASLIIFIMAALLVSPGIGFALPMPTTVTYDAFDANGNNLGALASVQLQFNPIMGPAFTLSNVNNIVYHYTFTNLTDPKVNGKPIYLNAFTFFKPADVHIVQMGSNDPGVQVTTPPGSLSINVKPLYLLNPGDTMEFWLETPYLPGLVVSSIGTYSGVAGWTDVDNPAELYAPVKAPVPEPSTLLLIGSGLIGLAGLRKKFSTGDE